MFAYLNKTATILAVTTALLAGSIGTSAQAGQSCWGLEGQALSDCIDKLIDELSDASNPSQSSKNGTVVKGFAVAETPARLRLSR